MVAAMNAVALFPLAGSSGNCADRQDSAVILTASRVPIEVTVEEARVLFTQAEVTTPMLQLAAHPPPVATFRRGVQMKGILSAISGERFAVAGGGFCPEPIARVPAFG